MLGYMRALGLHEGAWWLSFWVVSVASVLVASLLMIIVGNAFSLPSFTQTNTLVHLLTFLFGGLSSVAIACLLGVICKGVITSNALSFCYFLVGLSTVLVVGFPMLPVRNLDGKIAPASLLYALYDPTVLSPAVGGLLQFALPPLAFVTPEFSVGVETMTSASACSDPTAPAKPQRSRC